MDDWSDEARGNQGPVRNFVSGNSGTLLACDFGHAIFAHDREVVQDLFPMMSRSLPPHRCRTYRHMDQL